MYPDLYDVEIYPHHAIIKSDLFKHVKGRKAVRGLVMNIDYHLFVRLKHPLLVRPLFSCRNPNCDLDVLELMLLKKPMHIDDAIWTAYKYDNVRAVYSLGKNETFAVGRNAYCRCTGFGLGCKLQNIDLMKCMKYAGTLYCGHCGIDVSSHNL